ncbi:hypothetical protein H7I53_25295 [Mycolicibacterium pulveris]|uniref:DUF4386 domain-containing protein n=1 Tax=Mycolicibacterium pulveris TaxID=36813 RepID=A0A7I7UPT2_MYCPV|nr:hypothetical protein [Mycolicibacterium pulveris]MCV6983519.1 hypothetical protein [Mycolicibacterium pulveris]BBY83398.1 hypothetical protein MPUL_45560 [Mycolicibacterium pulveris]
MNEAANRRTTLLGAWCGIAYIVMLLTGWWLIGGFLPLHEPSADAAEIASFFRDDVVSLRIGMVIVMWAAAVFLPFAATMADFVSRFEGRNGPLTRTMTMAGYANAMLTFYPPLWWLISSWRASERSPELTYLLNDIAWLQFIGGLSLIMPMFAVVAVVALTDSRPERVFPRWLGYQSVMTFLLFLPDQMLFFFKTGPFAWNGVLGFWVPLTVFCTWFIAIFVVMRRSLLTATARKARSGIEEFGAVR